MDGLVDQHLEQQFVFGVLRPQLALNRNGDTSYKKNMFSHETNVKSQRHDEKLTRKVFEMESDQWFQRSVVICRNLVVVESACRIISEWSNVICVSFIHSLACNPSAVLKYLEKYIFKKLLKPNMNKPLTFLKVHVG